MLLIPDPRPLVERLGLEFFRQAPDRPGVYLMRDAADTVLYVGKAKSLRKRLASYRVANPDRLRRRHLRLLRAVTRIDLEECGDEQAALAREAELLRSLRPRFNRAGTWPGSPRFLAWRTSELGLELAVSQTPEADWHCHGPIGSRAFPLRAILVRLLWCVAQPQRGLAGMPEGWFHGRHGPVAAIGPAPGAPGELADTATRLARLFGGYPDEFLGWVRQRTATRTHPFERAVLESDLEALQELVVR